MLKKTCFALLFSLLSIFSASAWAQEADAEIHEELRAALRVVENAINTDQYEEMLPVLSAQLRATSINQEFIAGNEAIPPYFQRWFGEGGKLGSLEFHLTPDALTELSPDKSWGLVYGEGTEKYLLRDGRAYELKTRWTATMAKEEDGKWRVRAIHIGTNFLDNPILSEVESAIKKTGLLGAIGGLIVGFLLAFFLCRKKRG
jgi:ketosteroid isomerase-like protein